MENPPCKAEDMKSGITSSLKASSRATEGVLDYGVLREPAYVIWVGLMGREDTRLKTSSRVRMGLSFCVEDKLGDSDIIFPSL